MVTLVVVAAYFAAVYLGRRNKLRLLAKYVLRSARRLYGVSEFRFSDHINSHRGLRPPGPTATQSVLAASFDL